MTPSVRPALASDAADLARLRWDFRHEAGTPASLTYEEFVSEFRSFATDALADPDRWRAWVAESDGRIVGCVWLQLVEKVPHPGRRRIERPLAYVTNLYVAPELRNAGLGRRLLEEALAFGAERGVDGAVVWPTDRSMPFYERAGFGASGAPLWRGVSGD